MNKVSQKDLFLNILQEKKFIFLQFGRKYNKKVVIKRTNWMDIYEATLFQDNIKNKIKWRLHYYDGLIGDPRCKWILEQIIE